MFARVHQKSQSHMKKFFEMLLNCGEGFQMIPFTVDTGVRFAPKSVLDV